MLTKCTSCIVLLFCSIHVNGNTVTNNTSSKDVVVGSNVKSTSYIYQQYGDGPAQLFYLDKHEQINGVQLPTMNFSVSNKVEKEEVRMQPIVPYPQDTYKTFDQTHSRGPPAEFGDVTRPQKANSQPRLREQSANVRVVPQPMFPNSIKKLIVELHSPHLPDAKRNRAKVDLPPKTPDVKPNRFKADVPTQSPIDKPHRVKIELPPLKPVRNNKVEETEDESEEESEQESEEESEEESSGRSVEKTVEKYVEKSLEKSDESSSNVMEVEEEEHESDEGKSPKDSKKPTAAIVGISLYKGADKPKDASRPNHPQPHNGDPYAIQRPPPQYIVASAPVMRPVNAPKKYHFFSSPVRRPPMVYGYNPRPKNFRANKMKYYASVHKIPPQVLKVVEHFSRPYKPPPPPPPIVLHPNHSHSHKSNTENKSEEKGNSNHSHKHSSEKGSREKGKRKLDHKKKSKNSSEEKEKPYHSHKKKWKSGSEENSSEMQSKHRSGAAKKKKKHSKEESDENDGSESEEKELNHGHKSEKNDEKGSYEKDEKGFEKAGGQKYNEEEHKKKGFADSKEYKKYDSFGKGKKGHYNEEDYEEFEDTEYGKKASDKEAADHHGQKRAANKGEKSGKFDEKKSHKKGSKTTGYHNVFHKDEYKKVHTFYDDADHRGKFKNFGSDHSRHESGTGAAKSNNHHHSSNDERNAAARGKTKNGLHSNEDIGYRKQNGNDRHYANADNYSKKGGKQNRHDHGHDRTHDDHN